MCLASHSLIGSYLCVTLNLHKHFFYSLQKINLYFRNKHQRRHRKPIITVSYRIFKICIEKSFAVASFEKRKIFVSGNVTLIVIKALGIRMKNF